MLEAANRNSAQHSHTSTIFENYSYYIENYTGGHFEPATGIVYTRSYETGCTGGFRDSIAERMFDAELDIITQDAGVLAEIRARLLQGTHTASLARG